MAKKAARKAPKKATKKSKPAPKKSGGKKQSRADVARVLAGPTRRTRPKDTHLPGMEPDDNDPLHKVCRNIAETRRDINDLKADEAGFEQTALQLMRRKNLTTKQYAGVTLVRVPGEERLQVKTTRGGAATAENEPDAPSEEQQEYDAEQADVANDPNANLAE